VNASSAPCTCVVNFTSLSLPVRASTARPRTRKPPSRVDYVRDPVGSKEEARVRSYFASIFPPEWDGGYDVDQYPSYGPDWLASGRPAVARLSELGVYDLTDTQEAFARSEAKKVT
jgi:hypothetical protein